MIKSSDAQIQDFPILAQQINNERLVYLDNAATAQKPRAVIEALTQYYQCENANVHRGVHTLAERATSDYEQARHKIAAFIDAPDAHQVIFTKGTTDGLNMVARSIGNQIVHEGDEIVISVMEHHSNLIPWQQLALRQGATLKYIGLTNDGELDMVEAERLITNKTKIVAVAHASNVMGVINPIKQLASLAHQHGAIMVGDGAQSVPHLPVDVQEMDVDFYAFSGHKMMGPTGIGVLYGKKALLETMPPVEFGGEMIDFVHRQESTWTQIPWKFEAGTQNIAGAIGLGAAVDYLSTVSMSAIHQHEQRLVAYLLPKLIADPDIKVYGPEDPKRHSGVIAFNLADIHPHDVATALDMDGVAIRAGHHCAQPLMTELNVSATCRASFYWYNTLSDADRFLEALDDTKEFFQHESTKAK